jgi:drug/metabolite transporter (DMT)-like permease
VSTPAPLHLSRAEYIRGALWGIAATIIWVSWILYTRVGVTSPTSKMAPIDLVALRFACAGLVMLPLLLRRGLAIRELGVLNWLVIVCSAGIPYVLLSSSGLQFAPAAQAGALIPGTLPLWAALLAMLILKEHISGSRRIGLALIPVGLITILGAGLFHFETGLWRGHLLFLAASICWATFSIVVRRTGIDGMHAAALVSVVSMVVYLPVYLLFLPHGLASTPWSAIIGQTLFQGIVVSIVSLVAFARAVSILGASLAASFASLVPVMAMLAAIPLLGEIPGTTDVIGIGVITAGVFLASGAYSALGFEAKFSRSATK